MFPTTPQVFAEAVWRGESRRFALALSDGFIYFWEPDSPQFQTAPQEWVFAVEGAVFLPPSATLNLHFLISTFKAALEERTVGRLLPWGKVKDPYCYVFLHPSGTGFIFKHQRGATSTAFRFGEGNEVFTQPASYWNERLQAWAKKKKPESDFAFALRWRTTSGNDQAQLLTQLGRGDWNELKHVAQRILTLEGRDFFLPGRVNPGSMLLWLRYEGDQFSYSVSTRNGTFTTKREALWQEWWRFFSPTLNYELTERYTAASYTADACGFEWRYSHLCPELSQHEYLETHLRLRDWLRDRSSLPDEWIAEILA